MALVSDSGRLVPAGIVTSRNAGCAAAGALAAVAGVVFVLLAAGGVVLTGTLETASGAAAAGAAAGVDERAVSEAFGVGVPHPATAKAVPSASVRKCFMCMLLR